MPIVPYNTGKVLIGSNLSNPPQYAMTPEGRRWQRLLLGLDTVQRREDAYWQVYIAAIIGGSMLAVALA